MLSIIVSWKNRKELEQSIESLVATAKLLLGEVVIVNFDGDSHQLEKQTHLHHDAVKVVEVRNQPLFNKAAANNIGASVAKYDYLFFCDCDIILDAAYIQQLLEKIKLVPTYFGTLKGVSETTINSIQNNHIISFGYELLIKTQDGRTLQILDSEEDAVTGARNAPGLLIISMVNFLAVNGYNGRLVGWGWEDQDMIGRLTLGAGLERLQHGYAKHISHSDEERTKHYPIANRWESRDKMFRQAIANYDARDFFGTYREDVMNYNFS